MSNYNPYQHHRQSIRLKEYDYATEGLYYVTMCTQDRKCLFGDIHDNEMILNDAGLMIQKWYYETQVKYPDIQCLEMIVMPNHLHCIWQNTGLLPTESEITADPLGKKKPYYGTLLSSLVQWFKTMSTNEYIRGVRDWDWPPFNKRLWQRNYYEHIIRDSISYDNIVSYILTNPIHWDEDELRP